MWSYLTFNSRKETSRNTFNLQLDKFVTDNWKKVGQNGNDEDFGDFEDFETGFLSIQNVFDYSGVRNSIKGDKIMIAQ